VTALALALAAAGCGADEPQAPETLDSGVVRVVVDGDTVHLDDGRRIRLVQIDAPEERRECYGNAATRDLERLVPAGSRIQLTADDGLDDRDDGGRLLRYVFFGGRNVNLQLVARGAAAPYFFRKARGRYADELLSAARDARSRRLGLWGACPGARLDPALGSLTGPA
jgi:endonuclease YncB( thermonuclease family)